MGTTFAFFVFCLWGVPTLPGEAPPAGIFVEAESPKPNSDCQVVDDAKAFGGKAVTSKKSWQPIFWADVPKDEKELTIWIRHRGGAICLKSMTAGRQKDYGWIWSCPKDWAWTNAGRFNKAQLGDNILLLRNHEGTKPDAEVDCVVFSPDPKARPTGNVTIYPREFPSVEPDDQAPPVKVDVKVKWFKIIGKMPPMIWGVADYEVMTPQLAADKGFNEYLKSIHPPLIRVHCGYQAQEWIDPKTKTWNVEKIKAGFDGATGFQGAKIMMNIAGWPEWMDWNKKSVVSPESEDKFVRLCVDFVRVMRDQVKHRIDYWEFPNEKDESYEAVGKLDDLWRLINKIAVAIKKEDPTAKVGGAAFTWNRPDWVKGLLEHCGKNIDFISWHNYAVGDPYISTEEVFRRIDDLARHARDTQIILNHYYPRKYETFITEYNLNWNWQGSEPRQKTGIAAVFDASMLKRWALERVTGVTIWHARNGIFGLIDHDNTIRPSGYLYQWGIPYLVGRIAETRIGDAKSVDCLPIIAKNGKSVLLMNKSPRPVLVPGGGKLLSGEKGPVRFLRINNKGLSTLNEVSADIILPGYSVTLMTTIPVHK
jgi:hypothetical protein